MDFTTAKKTIDTYNGEMVYCKKCHNSQRCTVEGQIEEYNWAINMRCQNCKNTFFICAICLEHSTSCKMSQLDRKRLNKHSIGKNHTQKLQELNRVAAVDINNSNHDEITEVNMNNSNHDEISNTNNGVDQHMLFNIDLSYFDRKASTK